MEPQEASSLDEKPRDLKRNDDADLSTGSFSDDKAPSEPQEPAAPNPVINKNALTVPNGGFAAWLQVACGFCLFFNTWGILNAFGVFQTYYESGELFTKSSSDISWIGAMQGALF